MSFLEHLQRPRASRRACPALLFAALLLASPAFAQQEKTYADEYQNRIKSAGAIQAASPFGENVDLYTGATSFEQVDLVLQGTGPDIRVARRSIKGDWSAAEPMRYSGFGDWELEIPQITTIVSGTAKYDSTVGVWRVYDPSYQASDLRCTYLAGDLVPTALGAYGPKTGGTDFTYWGQPYQLDVPGAGSQTFLQRSPSTPAPATGTYRAVTNQHWHIGCLPSTTSGHPGEAFVAVAPDGTKYFLTQMMFDKYQTFRDVNPLPPNDWSLTPRNVGRMKATRVEDRFGNYITYGYAGDRLTSITASDGRSVTIQWWADAPLIKSVTANGQVWTYAYASRSTTGGTLSQVTLPDSSTWTYTGTAAPEALAPVGTRGCFHGAGSELYTTVGSLTGITSTYTMKNPAGAVATFQYSTRLRAQSFMPTWCEGLGEGYETQNPYFLVSSLVQRQLAGPGMATATWSYAYEPAHASADRDCGNGGCQGTTYTDVTGPDGHRIRYVHSTRYAVLQGKLLRTELYENGQTLKRVEDISYNYAEGDRPYTGTVGSALFFTSPPFASENIVVTRKNVITQQGRRFTWEVPGGCAGVNGYCFDWFGRPTKVVKSSSP